ncbi:Rad4 beta-hairpin domain 3-domain-containing protein [Syncephalis fuscata]|nr:Rad4 beta-hairpin domain 3-domain-containing protein [Syncephalis fuscata]
MLVLWNDYYWIDFKLDRNKQYAERANDSVKADIDYFIKCLEMRRCSKNDSALLFSTLLYTLGHRVRLVVSFEPTSHTAVHSKSTKHPKKQSTLKQEHFAESSNDLPAWCEVLHPDKGQWISVDVLNSTIDKPDNMEHKNPLPYVTAFEYGNRIKDVSRRYASQWAAKTLKRRPHSAGLQSGRDWWAATLTPYQDRRPTDVDARENAELLVKEKSERMPTTVGEFNNHPLYALERHLKKFEILYPREPIIGHIRGEPVYPRSCVQQLHTTETWLREGRQVKEGENPIKEIKARAVTLQSRREQAMAEMEGMERISALYGEWQTEPYTAPPIINGKVPKNQYGNIDLFQPSMLPSGGCHIQISGIAKIARKLKIDYADAVTGFDFQQRRCIPILSGIVIPSEREEELLQAWHVYEAEQIKKNRIKREKAALQRWRQLVRGIRIRDRLRQDYGEDIDE